MDPKSKEFKRLRDEWYGKLRKDGFHDIEDSQERIIRPATEFTKRSVVIEKSAWKQEYYRLAGQFLYDFQFSAAQDRQIWEMHAGGRTTREILSKFPKSTFDKVRGSIEKHRKLMIELYDVTGKNSRHK